MSIGELTTDQAAPPLEHGDRLDRREFERRYDAMPACKKAELIEGVVYMPPPVHFEQHGGPHFDLIWWLGSYKVFTPGVLSADNTSNRLDLENMPQPDAMMFIDPAHGGEARISEDDYVVGPPEFVAEVSASSASYDRGPKLRVFRRHGVKEYLIWRVNDRQFDWFVLRNGDYAALEADENGVLRSETFPGLWLNTNALLAGDLAQVLATLQQGIASTEHEAFVQGLQQYQSQPKE